MNVNQFSYVMLFLLGTTSLLIQCKSTQASVSESSVSTTVDLETAVSKFIEAIKKGELKELHTLLPTAEVARAIAPGETETLSDRDIEEKMLTGLKERFNSNMENIWSAIEETGMDRTDVSPSRYKAYPAEGPDMPSPVVNISFTLGERSTTIPVTYMEHDGGVYFFEILM